MTGMPYCIRAQLGLLDVQAVTSPPVVSLIGDKLMTYVGGLAGGQPRIMTGVS